MGEVLLWHFEHSNSFKDAKSTIKFLEELVDWEPAFAARIRAAAENNSQISLAFGVPARAEALARKWEGA